MYRAYTYRLKPTVKQTVALTRLLALQCELYNAALEERKRSFEWLERGISSVRPPTRFDQYKTLTGLAGLRFEFAEFGVTVCCGTLFRLDEAFAGFFRRIRAGQKPGYPRFSARACFDSVSWPDVSGWKLDEAGGRLVLQWVGHVKVHLHRSLQSVPRTITLGKRARSFEVTVLCAEVPKERLAPTRRSVGIDLGVHVLAATSDGQLFENPRPSKTSAERLATLQRQRSRHRRGSSRSNQLSADIARLRQREANRRKDHLHKLSRQLVDHYDLIVFENLKISNMSRSARGTITQPGVNVKAKAGLNDAIADSGWGTLISMTIYKAEGAGREILGVNPASTSQRCSACGHTAPENRHKQCFVCVACGFEAHADVNAAKNIHRAGLAQDASVSERQVSKSSDCVPRFDV